MAVANHTEIQIEYKESFNEQLSRLSAQLSVMMVNITGDGFESFGTLSDKLQHNYLWACADKAMEIEALVMHNRQAEVHHA